MGKGKGFVQPDKLNSVILFTSDKRLRFLARKCLEILESRHNYIKNLEGTFIKMGVGDYENSVVDYNKDRKLILDALNDGVREIEGLKNLIS